MINTYLYNLFPLKINSLPNSLFKFFINESISLLFTGLSKKCEQTMEGNKFPVSIIYINEIDKIATGDNILRDSIGSKSVQE